MPSQHDIPDGILIRTDMSRSLDRINHTIRCFVDRASAAGPKAFETLVMNDNLKVISVTPEFADAGHNSGALPVVSYSLLIKPELCSAMGQLHGAATALIFDMTTSIAIAPKSRPGFWEFHGVSRNLNVSYYRPVPVGSRVMVEARVVQIGSRLATIVAELKGERGETLASVQHDKCQVDPVARLIKM